MSENNDNSNESSSMGSDTISSLQSNRTGLSGGNPLLRSGVLRPSVLGTSLLNSATSSAPSSSGNGNSDNNNADTKSTTEKCRNPFLKDQDDNDDDADEALNNEAGAVGGVSESAAPSNAVTTTTGTTTTTQNRHKNAADKDDDEPDERPDPLTLLRKNGIERANLFAAAKNSIPRVEKSGFVFGQNVHERVVGENLSAESASKPQNADVSSSSGSELLFSSVIQNAACMSKSTDGAAADKESEAKSLNDVAREYEESRAQKRKYEEVATFTGEENEVNIVDVNCKLFAFVNSNWEERGRGSLRLNDSKNETECSRVVFRTSGNLRLLLNTKVWAGMVAERPSQKSLRLTAMDNTGKIKIFLVMARPVDINQLYKALVERIELRQLSHPEEGAANNGEQVKNGNGHGHVELSGVSCSEPDGDETEGIDEVSVVTGTEENATTSSRAVATSSDEATGAVADCTEPSPKKQLLENEAVATTTN